MLTWSFGCAPSPARFAITSLAFMFDEVPEPVWNTSIGNWSSNSPAATRSAAAAIRSAVSRSSRPSSALTRAAAPLIRPSQRITDTGTVSPETGKLSTAFVVSPPHSCSVSWTLMPVPFAQKFFVGAATNGTAGPPPEDGRRQPQNAISSRATATGSS